MQFYTEIGRFAFLSRLGELEATYDDHLGLIGKRVVDFLLVLIELFSLGVAAEVLRAKIGRESAISLQRGHFDPKFQVERVAPTNHFCIVIVRPLMPYNFVAESFHRKKLCSRLS